MTVARFPQLAHWGAFTALVENGRVIGCEPFARDPAPSDMLEAIPAMVHSPLRIARPAIRDGWREGKERTGADSFHEVSWDEALATVAGELARVRETFGNTAIFGGSYGWSSAGHVHGARSLLRRFLFLGGGCVDQVANYSFGAAQYLLPRVIGTFQPIAQATEWPSVIKHTRLILAFGGVANKNAQVTFGGGGAHTVDMWLRRTKEAGIEVVSISPLKSDAPDFVGAEWVPIRPNTDTALMLAMAHTLLTEKRYDAAFVSRYCAGFDRFRRYLLGLDDGVAKDAAWAAAITAVPAETILALARRAAAARTLISCAWSLQRAHHGEQPYWAAIVLAAMLGGIGLPGGGFAFGYGSMNGIGEPRIAGVAGPDVPLPLNPARTVIPVARIADMLLNPDTGYDFNGRQYTFPDVRLVYWAGGNPFHHHQDLNRLQCAWQKPQTVIVHETWWTATARHADIVLPATTSLERNDVGGSSRDPFILAMHRAIDPVADAKNDFDIFRALAQRLGYERAFTEDRDEMGWCQWVYDRVRASATAKGVALPGFQQFWAEGFVELPPPERDYVLFEDFRRDPERHPLKTPSGRIEIMSEAVAGFGYPDCPPHPAWIPPAEWLGSAAAQRFPLHLVTHQPASRLHAQMDPGPVSRRRKIAGREPVRINPQDAVRRGIRDGDVVRLFNARGACLAGALLDADVMPGVAVMATGAWLDPADAAGEPERHGNPNVLTLDVGTSALGQGTSALTTLIEIERWEQPVPAVRAFTPPTLVAAS